MINPRVEDEDLKTMEGELVAEMAVAGKNSLEVAIPAADSSSKSVGITCTRPFQFNRVTYGTAQDVTRALAGRSFHHHATT